MIELEYIVGLVIGLTELLKQWVPSKYLPLMTVFLGAGLNVVNALVFGGDPMTALKDGLVAAGLAVGIFSGVKNTFEGRNNTTLGA